jgi:hypothetical protein
MELVSSTRSADALRQTSRADFNKRNNQDRTIDKPVAFELQKPCKQVLVFAYEIDIRVTLHMSSQIQNWGYAKQGLTCILCWDTSKYCPKRKLAFIVGCL